MIKVSVRLRGLESLSIIYAESQIKRAEGIATHSHHPESIIIHLGPGLQGDAPHGIRL